VTTVTFGPFTYEAEGTFPIWGWVDCQNNVMESNDNNNKLRYELIIGNPDLVVDSVTPSVSTPTLNTPFDLSIVVRNAGSRDAVSFEAAIIVDQLADPGQEPCPAQRQYVPIVEAGASMTITFQVTLPESRAYRIWGIADACAVLDEAREDNNTRSLDVNVGNNTFIAPDLVVESIRVFEIPTPEWGAVTTFDVTVRNVGSVTSGACRVGDFAAEFPGPLFGGATVIIGTPGPTSGGVVLVSSGWSDCAMRSREVPALPPGASATVQFWRYYSQAGEYTFGATADVCGTLPNNIVSETSESNNWLTVAFEVVACDADADNDGVCDADDFCPNTYDLQNNDSDNDRLGDACDPDDDNDGVDDGADCEPLNPFIYPGATEDCRDGLDNNCDGQTDEGAVAWFRDADGDSVGVANETYVDCAPPFGYVGVTGDCDDSDPRVYPGANGPCDDGLDNDCDGVVDNESPVWGRDTDGDGYTDPGDVIVDSDGVCDGQPAGYSLASAIPDPDDNDFMVPEPVVISPTTVAISGPQTGLLGPAFVRLARNGPEPYMFTTQVTYGPEADGWLTVTPASGAASGGSATLTLAPDTSGLPLAQYSATVRVTINNGVASFDVPVGLTVRNPILRVVHSGGGSGSVYAYYYDNAVGSDVSLGEYDTDAGTFSFEAEVPLGEGVYLQGYADECSTYNGLFDENQRPLPFQEPNDGGALPVPINRDTTISADFAPEYLLCSSCATLTLALNLVGLWRTRPRSAGACRWRTGAGDPRVAD
jgi:hypothetical protein